MKMGICPFIVRVLIVLNGNMMGTVNEAILFQKKINVFNGVLSLALFSIYIDELIKLIQI